MVRILAKNIERKLQDRVKGYVKVSSIYEYNDYTLIIDISNNGFNFRQLIRDTKKLINLNTSSEHLCNQILSNYKDEISTAFFK